MGDKLFFFALTDLPSDSGKSTGADSELDRLIRAVKVCARYDEDGKEYVSLTPYGLLNGLTNPQANELGLGDILVELEKRDLMSRRMARSAQKKWYPTAKGRAARLGSKAVPAFQVLLDLGLGRLIEKIKMAKWAVGASKS